MRVEGIVTVQAARSDCRQLDDRRGKALTRRSDGLIAEVVSTPATWDGRIHLLARGRLTSAWGFPLARCPPTSVGGLFFLWGVQADARLIRLTR